MLILKSELFVSILNETSLSILSFEQPTNFVVACFIFDLLSFLHSEVYW